MFANIGDVLVDKRHVFELERCVGRASIVARINMKLSDYRRIHEDRSSFIIKLMHDVKPIEKVIITESDYCVVKKNNTTPEPGDILNKTSIDNSAV